MTQPLHPRYHFATEAQWASCQFVGSDNRTKTGLRPYAPYGLPAEQVWSGGARLPALTVEAELLWLDDQAQLQRLPYGNLHPRAVPAPRAIRTARKLVATPATLWALGTDCSVQAFDSEDLSKLIVVRFGELKTVDLTWDSHDAVYVLAKEDGRDEVLHLDCAGNVEQRFTLDESIDATSLAFLGIEKLLVLLAADGSRLYFVDASDGALARTLQMAALRTCFEPSLIVSDGCARLFIAGVDGKALGEESQIILSDADGNLLGVAPVEASVTGLVATRSQLFAATKKNLVCFKSSDGVPQGWGELRASVLTPLLRSPSKGAQKWMRVEAAVDLPQGCSLEISWASADSDELWERAGAILADQKLTQAQRLRAWTSEVQLHTSTYHGGSASGPQLLSAPLHDVRDGSIWVEIALTAAPGGKLPLLSELSVLYPGPTLVENLPAIYRRGELESGDFLRGLVGVLEAETQQLDSKIGDLGRNIQSQTAGDAWLDYVASWLGLPWDNGLMLEQKRRLVGHAAAIVNGYGTRAGLEALLDSLFPGRPRRYRLTDMTVDYGLATIAGQDCEGSRLPAILGGLPASSTALGTKSVLGIARLPCADEEGETARLLGMIRVEVEAAADEHKLWSPWLSGMIDGMLPAGARTELHWISPGALSPAQITEDSRVEAEPEAQLGSNAVTGKARLGGRARRILPDRLTRNSTLQ